MTSVSVVSNPTSIIVNPITQTVAISLAGTQGASGPQGPTGPTGPTGPAGPNLINSSTATTFTGILKGNGANVAQAVGDADYQLPISLTTTGTSGAATFSGNTLNVPQYSGGAFNTLTSGTNTIAAMLVGTGASLMATGSGTIAATTVNTINGLIAAGSNITLTGSGTSGSPYSIAAAPGTSIGGPVIGGAAGSVLFIDPTATLAQDNANFFWDETNKRLGIGINSPGQALTVQTTTSGDIAQFLTTSAAGQGLFLGINTTNSTVYFKQNTSAYAYNFLRSTSASTLFMLDAGNVGVNTGATIGATLQVNALSPSTVGQIIQGAASQTADLQEWQNSAGVVLSKVNASGQIIVGGVNLDGTQGITFTNTWGIYSNGVLPIAGSEIGIGAAYNTYSLVVYPDNGVTIGNRLTNGTTTAAMLNVVAAASTDVAQIITGAPSQTADLQQWQNSSSAVLANITAGGNFTIPTTGATLTIAGNPGSFALNLSTGLIQAANGNLTVGTANPTAATNALYFSGAVLQTAITQTGGNGVLADYQFFYVGAHTLRLQGADPTTYTKERLSLFDQPTITSANAAQTITTAATLAVAGAPVAGDGNTTITNSLALWIQSGNSQFGGAIQPASLADSAAPNNSLYYSTTASKLSYKDTSGVVHNLY